MSNPPRRQSRRIRVKGGGTAAPPTPPQRFFDRLQAALWGGFFYSVSFPWRLRKKGIASRQRNTRSSVGFGTGSRAQSAAAYRRISGKKARSQRTIAKTPAFGRAGKPQPFPPRISLRRSCSPANAARFALPPFPSARTAPVCGAVPRFPRKGPFSLRTIATRLFCLRLPALAVLFAGPASSPGSMPPVFSCVSASNPFVRGIRRQARMLCSFPSARIPCALFPSVLNCQPFVAPCACPAVAGQRLF